MRIFSSVFVRILPVVAALSFQNLALASNLYFCMAKPGATETIEVAIRLASKEAETSEVYLGFKNFFREADAEAYAKRSYDGAGRNVSFNLDLSQENDIKLYLDPTDPNFIDQDVNLKVSKDAIESAAKSKRPTTLHVVKNLKRIKLNTAQSGNSELLYGDALVAMKCSSLGDIEKVLRVSQLKFVEEGLNSRVLLLKALLETYSSELDQTVQALNDLQASYGITKDDQKILDVSVQTLQSSIDELKKDTKVSQKTIQALEEKLKKLKQITATYIPANEKASKSIAVGVEVIQKRIEELNKAAAELSTAFTAAVEELKASVEERKKLESLVGRQLF